MAEFLMQTWESKIRDSEARAFLLCLVPFAIHQTIFWTYSIILLWVDSSRPKDVSRYKLQKLRVTWDEIKKCSKRVLFNQFLVVLPLTALFSWYSKDYYDLDRLSISSFPPWYLLCSISHSIRQTVLIHLSLFILVEEIAFYYSHRLLHYGYFYAHIHKIHHEFKAPIGMASEYAHPIEMIVSNLVPIMIGPAICRSHIFVIWGWFIIAIIGTISHHCGYIFPFLIGGLDPRGILDKVHGTDKGYQGYLENLNKNKQID